MTYKLIINVGEKKVVVEVESDEDLGTKYFYIEKVLKKKSKPNPKSDEASLNFLKNMFGT
jgi:hypothetical protein